jgi:hypothetical protein
MQRERVHARFHLPTRQQAVVTLSGGECHQSFYNAWQKRTRVQTLNGPPCSRKASWLDISSSDSAAVNGTVRKRLLKPRKSPQSRCLQHNMCAFCIESARRAGCRWKVSREPQRFKRLRAWATLHPLSMRACTRLVVLEGNALHRYLCFAAQLATRTGPWAARLRFASACIDFAGVATEYVLNGGPASCSRAVIANARSAGPWRAS